MTAQDVDLIPTSVAATPFRSRTAAPVSLLILEGVVAALLTATSLLAFLGLRCPAAPGDPWRRSSSTETLA